MNREANCTCEPDDCYERQYIGDGRHFLGCPAARAPEPARHTCVDRPLRQCEACQRVADEQPDSDGLNAARGFFAAMVIAVPLWVGFLCWLFK